jgi:hypothetical protein
MKWIECSVGLKVEHIVTGRVGRIKKMNDLVKRVDIVFTDGEAAERVDPADFRQVIGNMSTKSCSAKGQ